MFDEGELRDGRPGWCRHCRAHHTQGLLRDQRHLHRQLDFQALLQMEHGHLCFQQVRINNENLIEFIFSICVTHAQYFGKPILCDAGHASSGVDEDVLSEIWMTKNYKDFVDSRWLLLDVCNISAPSKLQRSVQQRPGGGGQESVFLARARSRSYLFRWIQYSAAVPSRRGTGKWTFQTYFSLLNISTLQCIFNLFAYLQYSTYPSLSNTYNLLLYRDVYTSFYQWVPPFLIASACLFYLPRFLHMTYITVSCNSSYRGLHIWHI